MKRSEYWARSVDGQRTERRSNLPVPSLSICAEILQALDQLQLVSRPSELVGLAHVLELRPAEVVAAGGRERNGEEGRQRAREGKDVASESASRGKARMRTADCSHFSVLNLVHAVDDLSGKWQALRR